MEKYRIFCNTDNREELVISNTSPTFCPLDSGHSIDINSVVIVEPDVKFNDGSLKDSSLTLDEYKILRIGDIDVKTYQLLAQGFAYDSKVFSLAMNSMIYWSALKNQTLDFTFPMNIRTLTGEIYSLTEANVPNLWNGAKSRTEYIVVGGNDKINDILNCVDKAAVDAIVDNRT